MAHGKCNVGKCNAGCTSCVTWTLFFAKSSRFQLHTTKKGGVEVQPTKKGCRTFGFSRWIFWVSVQQSQEHVLILLSKLTIQTGGVTTQTWLVSSEETGQQERRELGRAAIPMVGFSSQSRQVALLRPLRPRGRLRCRPLCPAAIINNCRN